MKKRNLKDLSAVSAGGLGLLCCSIISILLLLAATVLIQNGQAEQAISSYLIIPIHLISSFLGSAFAGRLTGEKRGLACVIGAGGYLLILLITSLLFMDGIHGQFIFGTMGIAIGCGCAILLNARKKEAKKKRVKTRFR